MRGYLLLLIVLFLCPFTLWAQGFGLGATLGLSYSDPNGYDGKVGFSLGLKGEYTFKEDINQCGINFSLLFLSRAWSKDNLSIWEDESHKVESSTYYLEIPILVRYAYRLTKKSKLFVETGPYLACGLFGKSKLYMEDHREEYDVFSQGYNRRFDLGIRANIGVEFYSFELSLGWSKGFINPSKDWAAITPKDMAFSFQVAYLFGKTKTTSPPSKQ